jgi:hypothetical protein
MDDRGCEQEGLICSVCAGFTTPRVSGSAGTFFADCNKLADMTGWGLTVGGGFGMGIGGGIGFRRGPGGGTGGNFGGYTVWPPSAWLMGCYSFQVDPWELLWGLIDTGMPVMF